MRITGSPSTKKYRAQGRSGPGFFKSPDRKSLGLYLMAASAALGLALLIWMGAYARMGQSVLPRLRDWLDRASPHTNGLPTLHLNLDLEAYQALAMQRQKALRAGILLPADVAWVAAQAHFEGQTHPLRVRLAGSEPSGSALPSAPPMDHWAPDKWSLEVKAEGEGEIYDARAFTLCSPATQGYLNGWLFTEGLRRAGIPAPSFSLINLTLNGEDWGIYALGSQPFPDPSTFGAELRGRFLAHADLWGAWLRDSEHRPQFLAAPDTAIAGLPRDGDPVLSDAYVREAMRISQPEYLRALEKTYRQALRRHQNALASEFFPAYLRAPWDALAERQQTLSAALQSQELAGAAPLAPDVGPGIAPPRPDMALPPAPTIEEALARHPLLQPALGTGARSGYLQVRPGTWRVDGDLVLPEGTGLYASEAFTLTFERGAALLARGPLALHGPEGESIRLLPAEDHWGGIFVVGTDTGEGSSLHNVEIRGARGIQRDAWRTSGGITFVDMPVQFHRCRVLDSYAPAAAYIVSAPFECMHSEFGIASGDLLSIENARGHVERCAFHDTLGSAIRLYNSKVDVHDVSLLRVQDVAILADAGSTAREQGIRAVDVGIAVAAVDGAFVDVRDARIGQAHVAGLAAYREDARKSPGRVEASGVMFQDDSRPALAQHESNVTLDGFAVETQDVASAALDRAPKISPPVHPLHVRFGPSIWLVGYELTTPERAPGETVEVILYWRALASLDRQYTVFMHLLDASGEWVAGWDMMPRYNTYPTTDWPVAELIDDVRILPLSSDLPPGKYTVALGMYDWGTGERLPAYTGEGHAIPNQAVILEDTVAVK